MQSDDSFFGVALVAYVFLVAFIVIVSICVTIVTPDTGLVAVSFFEAGEGDSLRSWLKLSMQAADSSCHSPSGCTVCWWYLWWWDSYYSPLCR
jgi:hypothetical protein